MQCHLQRECRSEITCSLSNPNPIFLSWTKGLTQIRTSAYEKRVHVKPFSVQFNQLYICAFCGKDITLFVPALNGNLWMTSEQDCLGYTGEIAQRVAQSLHSRSAGAGQMRYLNTVSVCMSLCLSVTISIYLSIYLYIYIFVVFRFIYYKAQPVFRNK